MEADTLWEAVASRMGMDLAEARPAAKAVLAALCEALPEEAVAILSETLPRSLVQGRIAHRELVSAEAFYRRVAEIASLGRASEIPAARELSVVVGQVLAEWLDEEALSAVRRTLSPSIGELFAWRGREAPAEPRRTRGTTLATGRPGSCHPIAEAKPERTQGESVAVKNPHAVTKLSSASGTTAERERRTLSSGRPGDERPPSES